MATNSAGRRTIRATLSALVLSGVLLGGGPARASGSPRAVIEVFPGPNAISTALASANPGDILNIHAGDYPEHLNVNTPSLTLRAAGDGTVTVDGGCHYLWAIQVFADATRFRNITVVGGTFGSITFSRVSSGAAQAVIATDTCGIAEYGINVFLSGSIVVTSNTTSGFSDAGIYVGAISSTPFGPLVVQRNDTFDNDKGIIIEDSAGGTIRAGQNQVHDNDTAGLWLHNSDGVGIRGNTLTDNGANGIEVDPDSDGNLIARNTVSGHTYDLANEGGTGNCFRDNVYTTSFGDISC